MKKNLLLTLTMAGVLTANLLSAQYNTNYATGTTVDIVDASTAGKAYSCELSTDAHLPIILQKLDFLGNVVFLQGFAIPAGSNIATMMPKEILHTANDEYIVVGTVINNATVYNPFAARFSSTGGLQWIKVYNSNTSTQSINGAYHKVNICRVQDDPVESYIITACGEDPNIIVGASGLDLFVNAIRIDATGNTIWNKKYIQTGPPYNNNLNDTRDYPESLVFINNSSPRYFIGGGTQTYTPAGGGDWGFFMGIDKNGTITDPYKNVATSLHWNEEAIYDAALGQVVTGCTAGNLSVGITGSASAVAVSKYNATGALAHISTDAYAMSNSTETYFYGLKMNATNSAYIINAWVYPTVVNGPAYANMALLKIRKTVPTPPLVFNDFNVGRTSYSSGIISLVDPGSGTENYVMAGYIPPATGGTGNTVRVISTNVSGSACGAVPVGYLYNNPTFPTPTISLSTTNLSGDVNESIMAVAMVVIPTSCTGVGTTWRTSPTNVNEPGLLNNINLYPTLLQGEREVSLDLNVENTPSVDVLITSLDGKTISHQVLNLLNGANHLKIAMPEFASGTYMFKATSADGAINKTFKMTRL